MEDKNKRQLGKETQKGKEAQMNKAAQSAAARRIRKQKLRRKRKIIKLCELGIFILVVTVLVIVFVRKITSEKRAVKTYMKGVVEFEASYIEKVTDSKCKETSKAADTIVMINQYKAQKTEEASYEIKSQEELSATEIEELSWMLYGRDTPVTIEKAARYNALCSIKYSSDDLSGSIQNQYVLVSYKKDGKWYICRLE